MIYLLQGIPGSGKSSWCERKSSWCERKYMNAWVCSADHFFMVGDKYVFDRTKLGEAHAECMRSYLRALDRGQSVVVVDNTNLTQVEMAPYYLVAKAYRRRIVLVRFECDAQTAAKRNTHGVPLEAIERMVASRQDPLPFWDMPIVRPEEV